MLGFGGIFEEGSCIVYLQYRRSNEVFDDSSLSRLEWPRLDISCKVMEDGWMYHPQVGILYSPSDGDIQKRLIQSGFSGYKKLSNPWRSESAHHTKHTVNLCGGSVNLRAKI